MMVKRLGVLVAVFLLLGSIVDAQTVPGSTSSTAGPPSPSNAGPPLPNAQTLPATSPLAPSVSGISQKRAGNNAASIPYSGRLKMTDSAFRAVLTAKIAREYPGFPNANGAAARLGVLPKRPTSPPPLPPGVVEMNGPSGPMLASRALTEARPTVAVALDDPDDTRNPRIVSMTKLDQLDYQGLATITGLGFSQISKFYIETPKCGRLLQPIVGPIAKNAQGLWEVKIRPTTFPSYKYEQTIVTESDQFFTSPPFTMYAGTPPEIHSRTMWYDQAVFFDPLNPSLGTQNVHCYSVPDGDCPRVIESSDLIAAGSRAASTDPNDASTLIQGVDHLNNQTRLVNGWTISAHLHGIWGVNDNPGPNRADTSSSRVAVVDTPAGNSLSVAVHWNHLGYNSIGYDVLWIFGLGQSGVEMFRRTDHEPKLTPCPKEE